MEIRRLIFFALDKTMIFSKNPKNHPEILKSPENLVKIPNDLKENIGIRNFWFFFPLALVV